MKRYVVGFAFDAREEHVFLIQKNRPAWQIGRLNGIGGLIEPRETPAEAMTREFHEEAGVLVIPARWLLVALLRGDGYEVWFFATWLRPDGMEPVTRGDESVIAVSSEDLPETVIPNLRWLIPMARQRQAHDLPFCIRERDTVLLGTAFPQAVVPEKVGASNDSVAEIPKRWGHKPRPIAAAPRKKS